MVAMTRISVPAWAPTHAQHVRASRGDLGEQARQVIAPLLEQIYTELGQRVNEFVSDPISASWTNPRGFQFKSD